MKVIFISPCFNASKNLKNLIDSVRSQKDDRWIHIFIDDISNDDTQEVFNRIAGSDERFSMIKNDEKKYALRNITEVARKYQNDKDTIIAVIDGDDYICNNDTVQLLIDEYNRGHDVVWTGHRWDINNMNISRAMPNNVDPYAWPWSSSHLRTFKASLLQKISDDNFKDTNSNWFSRGYDQALMLPVLKVSSSRHYIDKICYVYNINSVSIPYRDYEERSQISTINIVRSRGFLK